MRNIINLYKQLFLLKISPEALPYSRALLASLIGFYFLVNVMIFAVSGKFSLGDCILVHGATILLSVFFLYTALKVNNQVVRLHKLLLALFGVDVFFLVLSILMQPINMNIQFIFAVIFTLWSLSIKTHIFSKGFNLKTFGAIMLMLSFEFVRHLPVLILIWPFLKQPS